MKPSRPPLVALVVVVALIGAALVEQPSARAGDRPLELFLGDMTPAGYRDCMRDVGRELRARRREVNVTRMGEPSVRRLLGRDEGDFVAWTADDLRPIFERRREVPFDAIALVDCREGVTGAARVLMRSAGGGVARLELRGVVIDEERARWIAGTVVTHGLIGFSP